jgi:hypothetical protein
MFELYRQYNHKDNGAGLNGDGRSNGKNRKLDLSKIMDSSKKKLINKRSVIIDRLDETAKDFRDYVMGNEKNLVDETILDIKSSRISYLSLNSEVYEKINRLQSQFDRAMGRAEELNKSLTERNPNEVLSLINLKQYWEINGEMAEILDKRLKPYIYGECQKIIGQDNEKGLMKRRGVNERSLEWFPPILEAPDFNPYEI